MTRPSWDDQFRETADERAQARYNRELEISDLRSKLSASEEALRAAQAHIALLKATVSKLSGVEERAETAEAALDSIRIYGSDTLSGRVDGPADAQWYREAVREMRNRARAALKKEGE